MLIYYVSFVEALFTTLSVSGLLWLRYKSPDRQRPIKVCEEYKDRKFVHLRILSIIITAPVFYSFMGNSKMKTNSTKLMRNNEYKARYTLYFFNITFSKIRITIKIHNMYSDTLLLYISGRIVSNYSIA